MAHSVICYRASPFAGIQFQQFKPSDRFKSSKNSPITVRIKSITRSNMTPPRRKIPKNLRFPRRAKLPAEPPRVNRFIKKNIERDPPRTDSNSEERRESSGGSDDDVDEDGNLVWGPDEIEAISSLFQGRIHQKPGKLSRERPLPLPMPHKIRPLGLPTLKKHVRSVSPNAFSSRSSLSKRVYKNPDFLITLAREIGSLPPDVNASEVLDRWLQFLRKGSLSITVRELGHMGLPERALQTFCWAQKHPQFFPDDRILSSTVEILARTRGLKTPFEPGKFVSSASRSVIEAMARGFIRAGSFNLARKLLLAAKDSNRTLDPSIHAKLILEVGKDPDKYKLTLALLDELGEREDLNLKQQDCTAVMKICIRLGKFEAVEGLFRWYKESGMDPSIVMYTTMIYSRYCEKKYREALALVWEMEESDYLLDLPAYRVVIKLCVALNDLSRCVRYFSKLKEAGFSPTYDIYRDLIMVYASSGRLAMVRQMCKEVELAGFKLDKAMVALLSQMPVGYVS
ncbi:pentatricopeptide repeat-containing protein At2g01860 isoform X2 [Magnolia sinica]|uniref:pentatricopeptide repeat-containing protein At2g01860 isoform X2 n=1 Tax=Magnolia sinica TaxID=86752 RepID=UPI00265910AB|nr:pentatricopeptide repeat-containing protein At2g01860 isoform X2 [Magnolia sinica]